MFGELEKNVFSDLEKNVFDDLEKRVRRFGENVIGENVGDLEKRGRRSYGDFVLEFFME